MLPLPTSGQCYYTVAFSPDGRWLAAGGSRCHVDVWDLRTPLEPPRPLTRMGEPIVRVRFAVGDQLVTHAVNWHRFDDTRGWAEGRFGPPGAMLVGGAQTNNTLNHLEVFDPESGQIIIRLPVAMRPLRVVYTPDNEHAATLTNGNLSVWHLPSRTLVVDRNGPVHGRWLSLAFAPNGRRIVTGGIDSIVGVWDALTPGPPLRTFQWGVGPVYAVAFDQDGLRAAAVGHSGVMVWDVDE